MKKMMVYERGGGGWQSTPPRAIKVFCWNCRRIGNPTTIRELKQLLVANDPDIVFLCETKIYSNCFPRIKNVCRMSNCLADDSNERSGGLAMLWREWLEVVIQSYSSNHIDSLVKLDNRIDIRFTSFYGHTDLNFRD
ncbi:hypothetical protein J1N35_024882 [Gossypium stocksii]|uniref:Endonuclease/exonuclease/phosphatase domain-containing protein n=1 Tax=Gossypium stocksii TaxID=47602 RepID=A0A9D3V5I6_9ROSI|nr:hypothetical protein J1N35_024882 [Gossypium stocksii]